VARGLCGGPTRSGSPLCGSAAPLRDLVPFCLQSRAAERREGADLGGKGEGGSSQPAERSAPTANWAKRMETRRGAGRFPAPPQEVTASPAALLGLGGGTEPRRSRREALLLAQRGRAAGEMRRSPRLF